MTSVFGFEVNISLLKTKFLRRSYYFNMAKVCRKYIKVYVNISTLKLRFFQVIFIYK